MDEQYYEQENVQEFTQDTLYEKGSGNGGMKERFSQQAVGLKERISEQAKTYGEQVAEKIDVARGKTSAGLKTTSEQIRNLATYMEEHDARDMSETLTRNTAEMVRRNPGKSILTGLFIGLLLGRIFSMGRR